MQVEGEPKQFHYPIGAHDQERLSNFITQMYNTNGPIDQQIVANQGVGPESDHPYFTESMPKETIISGQTVI